MGHETLGVYVCFVINIDSLDNWERINKVLGFRPSRHAVRKVFHPSSHSSTCKNLSLNVDENFHLLTEIKFNLSLFSLSLMFFFRKVSKILLFAKAQNYNYQCRELHKKALKLVAGETLSLVTIATHKHAPINRSFVQQSARIITRKFPPTKLKLKLIISKAYLWSQKVKLRLFSNCCKWIFIVKLWCYWEKDSRWCFQFPRKMNESKTWQRVTATIEIDELNSWMKKHFCPIKNVWLVFSISLFSFQNCWPSVDSFGRIHQSRDGHQTIYQLSLTINPTNFPTEFRLKDRLTWEKQAFYHAEALFLLQRQEKGV